MVFLSLNVWQKSPVKLSRLEFSLGRVLGFLFLLWFCFALFWFFCVCSMWEFPCQGLNLHHSNAGSLTHWATGILWEELFNYRFNLFISFIIYLCSHFLHCSFFPLLIDWLIFIFFGGAASMAYGSSQARGPIRTVAASLHHSHSNIRAEPHLWPTLQLRKTLDP